MAMPSNNEKARIKPPENKTRSVRSLKQILFNMILGCYYHTKAHLHRASRILVITKFAANSRLPLTTSSVGGIRFGRLTGRITMEEFMLRNCTRVLLIGALMATLCRVTFA